MNSKEDIVKAYFKSWVDNDISVMENVFLEDSLYIESWGPAYKGKEQLKKWFMDWNKNNKVLVWDTKEIIIQDNKVVCEWYFQYEDKNGVNDFNGVSIISFNNRNKIIELKEYMSKLPLEYPYEKFK